jgi:quinol-cytochrome oxidoreductase complex cytochrome b subunit
VIPLPELVSELAVGLGAALFAANAFVLLRPHLDRRGGRDPAPRPPSRARVAVNMAIGAVVAVWGLATILSR